MDLRALTEIALALGLATVWYIADDRNVFDWDFPSIEERFNGRAWRFDNNTFGINYLAHPLNGAGMYVLSRGNRIGVWPSFGYTVLGSTLWEFVIEFQEKVSINDMVVTPGVGIAMGEFFHKLAWYVSSGQKNGLGRKTAAWTLGLSVHGHRTWDSQVPPRPSGLDALGYSKDMWHRFEIDAGTGLVARDDGITTSLFGLNLSGQLVSIPGYLGPKSLRGWFHEVDIVRLALGLEANRDGLGYDLRSEATVVGYHLQRPGLAVTSGISLMYLLRNTDLGGYDDRQGLLLGPGLSGEVHSAHGPWLATLRGGLYPAFGSLSSLAYPLWRERHPDARAKTILGRAGYSYSFGWTARAEAALGVGPLNLEAGFLMGGHDSIQGLDRSQEEVLDDAPLGELVWEGNAGAWLRSSLPIDVGLSYSLRRRLSTMGIPSDLVLREVSSERLLLRAGKAF